MTSQPPAGPRPGPASQEQRRHRHRGPAIPPAMTAPPDPDRPGPAQFPQCILGPLLSGEMERQGQLPGACIVHHDGGARERMLADLAAAAAARGATVIMILHPDLTAPPGIQALPEPQAYRTFSDLAADPRREHPVLLVVPRLELPPDDLAQVLRDIRKTRRAYVVAGAATVDDPAMFRHGPDPGWFSLLWRHGGQ